MLELSSDRVLRFRYEIPAQNNRIIPRISENDNIGIIDSDCFI